MSRLPSVLVLAVVACVAVSGAAAAATLDREFHETFAVSPGARLELFHGDGDVEIQPWDRDVIDVSVHYHAKIKGLGVAREPDFSVEFERRGETVIVRGLETGMSGIGIFFNREIDYVYAIQAPAYVVLSTTGDDGDVEVQGWRAEIECVLDDGDLTLGDIRSASVRIEGQDGDVEIEGFEGELEIRVDDGDIRIEDCEASRLEVRAEDGDVVLDRCRGSLKVVVDDGDVTVTRASVSKLDVRTQDGDVDIELDAATDLDLYVDVEDGDVRVELPSGVSAAFTVETDDGSVRVSPETWILSKDDHRVTGEIGDARGSIRISTNDGDVTLR